MALLTLPQYPNSQARKQTPAHDAILIQLAQLDLAGAVDLVQRCSPALGEVVSLQAPPPGNRDRWFQVTENSFTSSVLLPKKFERDVFVDGVMELVGVLHGTGKPQTATWRIFLEVKTEIVSLSQVSDQLTRYRDRISTGVKYPDRAGLILLCPHLEEGERLVLERKARVITNLELGKEQATPPTPQPRRRERSMLRVPEPSFV